MSIEKKCLDCNVTIIDEWFFTCSGFMCSKVLSYSCATRETKKLISKYPNDVKKGMKFILDGIPGLCWFCPDCRICMKASQSLESTVKKIEESEVLLKNAIRTFTDKTNEKMQTEERRITRSQSKVVSQTKVGTEPFVAFSPVLPLTERLTPASTALTLPELNKILVANPSELITVPKTPELQISHSVPPLLKPKSSAVTQSSPVIPQTFTPVYEIQESTGKNTASPEATIDNILTISAVKPKRNIFISRIDPSVSDEKFKMFITKTFNIKEPIAIRMVPKAKNGEIYNYISYRLSVDDGSFLQILNSNLWPPGLFIKEFEHKKKSAFLRKTSPINQLI